MKLFLTENRVIISSVIIFTILLTIIIGWIFFGSSGNGRDFDNRSAHYAGPFKVAIVLNPAKPKVGDNSLTIKLRDKNNQPVTDAKIKAVAEMPAMGSMAAMPIPAVMSHDGGGDYTGDFELPMKGAWPLSLEISSAKTGDARLDFDMSTSRAGVRLGSATESNIARAVTGNSADPAMASGPDSGDKINAKINASNKFQVAGKYRIKIKIEPDTPKVGKNKLTITVLDKSDQPVTSARVRIVAQMPAMGSMEAMNIPAVINETGAGIYNGELELPMGGEWPLALDVETETLGHGDLTFGLVTGQQGLTVASATPTGISHYTCSMHPSVKSATPGTCPICGMDLVPVTKKEIKSGSISMDARRRQLIGVTTGLAREKQLIQVIRAAGRVNFDESHLTDITLKFNGWIGKLYADFVGAPVKKGQPLFTVYSPELLSAQQEYLETLRRRKNKQDTLLRASRQRLSLWDITPAQIRQLEKRGTAIEYLPIISPANGTVVEKTIVAGSAVKVGQKLLRIADLSTVWVEGEIYEFEIPLVKVGMEAKIVLPDQPGKNLQGKVKYIYPYLQGDTRTAKIRVELDNRDGVLKPDMYTHLHLKVDLGKRLVVPESAVLYAGDSRVVFLDLGNGRLQPRKIKTGVRNAEDIEVLEGLQPGDKVVTSGNFLIAAESKLKAGIDQW